MSDLLAARLAAAGAPTPWQVSATQPGIILDAEYCPVAIVDPWTETKDDAAASALAAIIVEAVNAAASLDSELARWIAAIRASAAPPLEPALAEGTA